MIGRDATMSPPKLISLLTGVFIAVLVAMASSAVAQDGLRLFKPYSPESFGGGRRSNDGVYGSVSGIYWSISTPKGGYIGATTINGDGETRWVHDGSTNSVGPVFGVNGISGNNHLQHNSANIDMMGPTTTLGTRFEVGNRHGQHGWLVTGYGLPAQNHGTSVSGMQMVIRDEGRIPIHGPSRFYDSIFSDNRTMLIWDNMTNSLRVFDINNWDRYSTEPMFYAGYLWGYSEILNTDTQLGESWEARAHFAPLPIWFESAHINIRSEHLSAELMYTYRARPFAWGAMELLAGARYWYFDDKFGFLGIGPTPTAGTSQENTGIGLSNASAFTSMLVDASGLNHVFGPQIGMKLTRQNARWTFGAEGRLTAGINVQTAKTEGYHEYSEAWTPIGAPPTVATGLLYPGQNNQTYFGHKKTSTVLSPIGELRLTADWQWTNAISFFGALDGMFAGNIARGVRVTDYVVSEHGIFGIRGNDRNTTILVYGVELGIKMNR